jgi:hypothetical protein
VKKKKRPKPAAAKKPERKPKGKSKGAPKPKGAAKPKAKAAAGVGSPAVHPEPTTEGPPGDADKPYGGFVLRLHDHDRRGAVPAVYGGVLRKVIFSKPIKTVAAPATAAAGAATANVQDQDTQLVAKLRDHLWALGFWTFPRVADATGVVGPAPSDSFDWRAEWAVREFQVATAMPYVAVDEPAKPAKVGEAKNDEQKQKEAFLGKRLSRLKRAKNEHQVNLEPNGIVTAETAQAIKYWLEHHYVCPLVIQAMAVKKDRSPVAAVTENVWCYDEINNAAYKMHAWDFSGHFSDVICEAAAVGDYQKYHRWAGPCSVPLKRQCLPEAEVSPLAIFGREWEDLTQEEKSTFRTVAGVAEQECRGYLDSVNFYDNCLGSIGPCHWTGPKDKSYQDKKRNWIIAVEGGELCGFMAHLEAQHPSVFKKCFSDLGIWGPIWGKAPGKAKGQKGRLYCGEGDNPEGYVYVKSIDYVEPKAAGTPEYTPIPQAKVPQRGFEESCWLKGWPWVYRLEMAARTIPEFRKAMFDYAVRRIERIRQMPHVGYLVPEIPLPGGATRKALLSDVVTGEQGTAVLLRFHVRYSGMLGATKGKYAVLYDALKQVMATPLFREKGLDGKPGKILSPDKWDTPHEVALVDAMLTIAKRLGDVGSTARAAHIWPFGSQLAAGAKGGRTPYSTHTWFPTAEVEVEETKEQMVKGKKVSQKIKVKMQVPTSDLQLSADRNSLLLLP